MNKIKFIIWLILLSSCQNVRLDIPLINAHAHNDYEHKRPLFDALENGFISIEVDVHLIDGELYVSHDTPVKKDSLKSLEELYLKPLLNHINSNKGQVYKDYHDFFYLMIDIKTEAFSSYNVLKHILKKYKSIISIVINDEEQLGKPVKIVITGMKGRPFHQILEDEPRYGSIDGRFNELDRGIPTSIMPYISENYNKFFTYDGSGEPSEKDLATIKDMVYKVHNEGKKLRFWASPDIKPVWEFLLENGVDLINTDSLSQFNKFALRNMN